jgi:opacity protein-like surface antigen
LPHHSLEWGEICRLAILVLPAALLGAASAGSAADIQVKSPPLASSPFSWAGFHVGGHAGALVATSNFSNLFGPSLFGDKVTTPGFIGDLQLGYDWLVAPRWVIGVGADASFLSSDASFTCLQASITIVGSDCAVRPRALATFTGRLGYVIDPEGRTLIYGKGGAA